MLRGAGKGVKIPAPRSFGLPDPPQPIANTRTSGASRIPRLNKATCVLAADDQAAGIRRTQPLQSPRGSGLPVPSPRSRFRASRTSSMRSNVLECEDDVDGTCSKGDDVAVGLSSSTTMVEDHTKDQRGRGALEEQATETDEEQAWDETRSREGEEDGVDDGQEEQRPLRPQQAQQQGWQEDDDSEGEAWHDVEDERIETSVSRTGVGVAQRISPTSHRISSKGEASKTVFELTAERIDANEEGDDDSEPVRAAPMWIKYDAGSRKGVWREVWPYGELARASCAAWAQQLATPFWHLCGWIERMPGERQNDGLETGSWGATAGT